MKKVLFVMTNLNTGGITTSLVNLLKEISCDSELSIDVLLFDAKHRDKLPKNVTVLPENSYLKLLATSQADTEKQSKILGAFRLVCGGLAKFISDWIPYNIIFCTHKKLSDYDYAISCTQSMHHHSLYGGCNEFILKRVKAKEKIAFLHCDYKTYGINTKHNHNIYKKFDKIVAVSNGVKNVFLAEEPTLENKMHVVHNCHDYEHIKNLAGKETVKYPEGGVHFITVARLSSEKGHDRLLSAFAKLKKDGYLFQWHIVGGADSEKEEKFLKTMRDFDLSDCVTLHGDQKNPYKFFTNADALVVPSYHEAAPMVFAEAECLTLPILSTETTSVDELVLERKNGFVCENSENGIYRLLKEILENPKMLLNVKKNMMLRNDLSNQKALREFYTMLYAEMEGKHDYN